MHGEQERARRPRLLATGLHLVGVGDMAWLLVGSGLEMVNAWWGKVWHFGVPDHRWQLSAFAAVYLLRAAVTMFYLLRRKTGWGECVLVGVRSAPCTLSLHTWVEPTRTTWDWAHGGGGVALYVFGSCVNTGSELQRKWWKGRPENKIRLYTHGVFRNSQHINYFGDEQPFIGYAFLTGSAGALLVPLVVIAGFVFIDFPELDKHFRSRYGPKFEAYAQRTHKFAPFVY